MDKFLNLLQTRLPWLYGRDEMNTIHAILSYILALDPVMFSIGPVPVRWYSLAYLAGFVLGWRVALYWAGQGAQNSACNDENTLAPRPARPTRDDIDDFLTWAVIGVIIGGRLGYVLFYQFDVYMSAPLEALKVWRGGMSFHGGMVGVIGAMALFSWRRGIHILRLSDIVAGVAPIGLFFGRMANFINGELYGRVTDHAIGLVFPYSDGLARHPSQVYEAILEGAALFIILLALRFLRVRTGVITGVFLIGYGAARMVVETVRQPDSHLGLVAGNFSMGQVLSMPMVMCGAGIIVYAFTRKRPQA